MCSFPGFIAAVRSGAELSLMKTILALAAVAAGARLLRRRYDWSERVVLIAGGSRGLGLMLARHLGKRGAKIVLAARDEETLARAGELLAGEGVEVEIVPTDLADREQARAMVEAAVARFGRLDVLVNAASIISIAPFDALALEDLHDAVNVNFWGTVHACWEALPHLRKSDDARIVNISSIGGVIAVPHLLPYTCGKFAVTGFSQGLQAELAGSRVRVTTVIPWLMRTGSPQHALVKGEREAEATLFTLSASLPGLTVSGERAARRIVRAAARGERFLTIGALGKGIRILHALAPGLSGGVLRGVAGLLPEAPEGAAESAPTEAREHPTTWTRGPLTWLGRRAAARNNEAWG